MTSQISGSATSSAPAYGELPCSVVFDIGTNLFYKLSEEDESAVTGGGPRILVPVQSLFPTQHRVAPIKHGNKQHHTLVTVRF